MPKYDEIDWDLAACKESIYTDLFYSVEEQRSILQYEYINALRQICGQCPIFKECLTYAFEHEDYGVWGGMTSLEREAMRNPERYPAQLRRALFDLGGYGIDYEMIRSCIVKKKRLIEK